jgi:hypothetical protein
MYFWLLGLFIVVSHVDGACVQMSWLVVCCSCSSNVHVLYYTVSDHVRRAWT